MQKHKLAGPEDSDTFHHEGVLCFDHHAAGQRTILVSRFSSHASKNFSGDRAFISSAFNRINMHVTKSELQPKLPVVWLHPDQLMVRFPVLSGALKTPPRAAKLQLRAGRGSTWRSWSTFTKKMCEFANLPSSWKEQTPSVPRHAFSPLKKCRATSRHGSGV